MRMGLFNRGHSAGCLVSFRDGCTGYGIDGVDLGHRCNLLGGAFWH